MIDTFHFIRILNPILVNRVSSHGIGLDRGGDVAGLGYLVWVGIESTGDLQDPVKLAVLTDLVDVFDRKIGPLVAPGEGCFLRIGQQNDVFPFSGIDTV